MISDAELEELALAAFVELPAELRERVANLAFVIVEEPPPGKH